MIKKFIGFVLFLGCFTTLFAQDKNVIPDEEICDVPLYARGVSYVDRFRDTLNISINLDEVFIGKKSKKVEFSYSAKISNESSVIRVSKDLAIRISIARVVENGNKFYLYKIHLYEKYKDCWHDRSTNGSWGICNLGVVNGGFYYGAKGTKNCFGYKGSISIE